MDKSAPHLVGVESQASRVPPEREQRQRMRRHVEEYVERAGLVPPLLLDQLREHADRIIETHGVAETYRDFVTVLVGNAVWQSTVAGYPFERRLLLLPQCLRSRAECPAEMDEFGLLCEECGRCPTGGLQTMAEELGYVVLIAEGTTVVTSLLEAEKVDAVIGVSCLHSLERSFPFATAAAVPGIAIPLVADGCDATQVDLDWVREAITKRCAGETAVRLDLNRLRQEVRTWFEPEPLATLLEPEGTGTERTACNWMRAGGKRWRPFLTAAVVAALRGNDEATTETTRKLAVAVECFHKASLAHDDIEDGDAFRYGEPTLHATEGMPVALNTGDLLVGEGYRLIGECGAAAAAVARMLTAAAAGHRELCLGQGEELAWTRNPEQITVAEVVEIFRRKTAPAFEVALVLGAIAAGADAATCSLLGRFSAALGVAYQIRDDIEDFHAEHSDNDIRARRPSLLLALALEHADTASAHRITTALGDGDRLRLAALVGETVHRLGLEVAAWQLFERYRHEALRTLTPLADTQLKSLMFRIVHKVLGGARRHSATATFATWSGDGATPVGTARKEVISGHAG